MSSQESAVFEQQVQVLFSFLRANSLRLLEVDDALHHLEQLLYSLRPEDEFEQLCRHLSYLPGENYSKELERMIDRAITNLTWVSHGCI